MTLVWAQNMVVIPSCFDFPSDIPITDQIPGKKTSYVFMSSEEQTRWDMHLIGLVGYKSSSFVTKEARLGRKMGRELAPCHCFYALSAWP